MSVVINGSAGVITNSGAVYNGLQTDTAKTATSTSVDFTDIPSWVKRITVMLGAVSLNNTGELAIQLGDSGGFETSGYSGCVSYVNGTNTCGIAAYSGVGFALSTGGNTSAAVFEGSIVLTLINSATNSWICSSTVVRSDGTATTFSSAGRKALSTTLDRVRVTTVVGTASFDAGTINIIYE